MPRFFLSAILFSFATALSHAAPPNIVLFISDDHSARDSSLYGAKDIRTPAMDRIAADGLTFDLAFAPSPSCAPSRGALLTGLMPARNGAEPNHAEPKADIKRFPAYLKELGYEVVAIGKVGHYKQTANYGFDHCSHMGYHDDEAVPAALEWLKNRQSDKPLCLLVGTNWPHVPWPENSGDKPADVSLPPTHVDTRATRLARTRYYEAIRKMDTELGQVYDLAREKWGTNLFFLHFSDQGGQWPFGKWCLYDYGLQTPMIAVWPDHTPPGKRTRAMVSLIDVLPTVIEAAGGTPPEDLDGKSFARVLSGGSETFREHIFGTHSGDGDWNVYPSRCVRDVRWKYIRNLHPEFLFTTHIDKAKEKDGRGYWTSWVEKAKSTPVAAEKTARYQIRPAEELYDLENDPWERKNLASTPEAAPILARMRPLLDEWMRQQGDQGTIFGKPVLHTEPEAEAAKTAP